MVDNYKVSVDGKEFDFKGLVPLYGAASVHRLAAGWQRQFIGYSAMTCATRFRDFTRFLRWVAMRAEVKPQSAEAIFFSRFQSGETVALTKLVVFEAGESWARKLRDRDCFEITPTTSVLSRRNLLESVSLCLRRLAEADLWESPGRFEPLFRGVGCGGNVPSFGELSKVDSPKQLKGWVKPRYDELNWGRVVSSNEERLRALRRICVRDLKRGLELWEAGQRIIADKTLPTPKDVDELLDELRSLHLTRVTHGQQELRRRQQHGLAIMIRYLAFTDPDRRFFGDWHGPLMQLGAIAGGWRTALAHVEGEPRSLVAAHAMVLIDTAFNVSTCDNLAAEPVVGDIKRGKVRIITVAAAKLRARGEMQEGDLLEGADIDVRRQDGEITSLEAIKTWQKISIRMRTTAIKRGLPASDYLWITQGDPRYPERVTKVTPHSASYYWLKMLSENFEDPVIGGVPIRRRMIRPTVLQIEAARCNFEHTVAAKLAQHKHVSTTMRYLSRPWFKALLASKMRTYLDAYQAGFAASIDGAGEVLDGAAYKQNIDHAVATGLGFLCTATSPIDGKQGDRTSCLAIDQCADCGFRQFRPTPESLRSLIVFRKSLTDQEATFRARNPARWAQVWLNFQALVEATFDKLNTSRHRSAVVRITKEVERDLAEGTIGLVPLW